MKIAGIMLPNVRCRPRVGEAKLPGSVLSPCVEYFTFSVRLPFLFSDDYG